MPPPPPPAKPRNLAFLGGDRPNMFECPRVETQKCFLSLFIYLTITNIQAVC